MGPAEPTQVCPGSTAPPDPVLKGGRWTERPHSKTKQDPNSGPTEATGIPGQRTRGPSRFRELGLQLLVLWEKEAGTKRLEVRSLSVKAHLEVPRCGLLQPLGGTFVTSSPLCLFPLTDVATWPLLSETASSLASPSSSQSLSPHTVYSSVSLLMPSPACCSVPQSPLI